MNIQELNAAFTSAIVPNTVRLGPIHLSVTDKAKALFIWRDVVGLTLINEDEHLLQLGTGSDVLVNLYLGASSPVAQQTTGLYHVAIHVTSRAELARILNRAIQYRIGISPTDHLVSEALYLWDLDGNGIEITYETPWRGTFIDHPELKALTVDGQWHSGREAIDVAGLMAELDTVTDPHAQLAEGTRIGHVHVHVNDLDKAMDFFSNQLGFGRQLLSRKYGMGDVTLNYAPHILAFNVWAGTHASQPPAGSAGLKYYELLMPNKEELEALKQRLINGGSEVRDDETGFYTEDPSQNKIKVSIAA